jgi:hypothetical protein
VSDAINPSHYKSHPSGVEAIDVTERLGFNVGNAVKYVWRAGLKGDALEDLKKARWYLNRFLSMEGAGSVLTVSGGTMALIHKAQVASRNMFLGRFLYALTTGSGIHATVITSGDAANAITVLEQEIRALEQSVTP